MLLLLFALLWHVTGCPLGSCTTAPELVCATSSPDVLCAECAWLGYLLENGTCVSTTSQPVSECSCTSLTGECIQSTYGARCAECHYRGFATQRVSGESWCSCYDTSWSEPSCGAVHSPVPIQANVTFVASSIQCLAFNTTELGCFEQGEWSEYGSPDPYVPTACCASFVGPPPGQLVEDGQVGWQECNTVGGDDPNDAFNVATFRTCSGHGEWDSTTYACICDPHWNAVALGVHPLTSRMAFTCRACFGSFGPLPPALVNNDETEELFCSAVYSPGPSGELEVCGGHGDYQNGVCVCYADAVRGYWGLTRLDSDHIRVRGDGTSSVEHETVYVCSRCADGLSGSRCDVGVPHVGTPAPTQAPQPSCPSCGSRGPTALLNVHFIQLAADWTFVPSSCCAVTTAIAVYDRWMVSSTTCTSEHQLRYLGSHACQSLTGCIAYQWTQERGYVQFKFTDTSGFGLVLSAKGGSGLACAQTEGPVPPTTMYPTTA